MIRSRIFFRLRRDSLSFSDARRWRHSRVSFSGSRSIASTLAMTLTRGIVAVALIVIAVIRGSVADVDEEAIRFLQKYGYLDSANVQTISSDNATLALKHAIALFQEYYRISGNGILNEATLELMRKPRCGVKDILSSDLSELTRKWPKTHLTWNFHLASESALRVAEIAFEMWAMNSSLTFERDPMNPDILISFQQGLHTFVDSRHRGGRICPSMLDGPGTVLAHAFLPSDEVSEVHIDSTEKWYIELAANPTDTFHLLYTLTHEIGHALGLQHSSQNDSIMYAYVPSKTFPVRLIEEDFLAIQILYGLKNNSELIPGTTTVATTAHDRDSSTNVDLCALRRVDAVLVLEDRIYVAYRRYLWSVSLNGKSYSKSLLLMDYLRFLPDDFTRLAGAYRRPSGQLVLFINDTVYIVEYPSFELVPGWPKKLKDMNFPPNAKINAVINTNTGRTFAIYNDEIVAEIDDCSMIAVRHNSLHTIFPGIPPAVTSVVRYIDGNLYFIVKKQFFKYNEFTKSVTEAGKFDAEIFGIVCPKDGLLEQLRSLLKRLAQMRNVFSNEDDLEEEEREEREFS